MPSPSQVQRQAQGQERLREKKVEHPFAGSQVGPSVADLRKTLTAIKQATNNKKV